ncbi:MAG: class I SAM-dependent methyltransferase [Candidatus Rokubacteria bacterium]|nr:class I SAM-dependent methyltransferase [Candidatus Rokubacteria bacterium]
MSSTPPHPVLTEYYRTARDRQPFVTELFDATAPYYERAAWLLSFGLDRRYHRWALERAGLGPGMRLLDVAIGTGLIAGSALDILGEARAIVGIDPSTGMLAQARRRVAGPLVQGRAEALPFRDQRFDVLTMGYALRHVPDLEQAFQEYLRVLKPGGRIVLLEISRPRSPWGRGLMRLYLQRVVPRILRLRGAGPDARVLLRYYWDTIAECVSPETILGALRASGFARAEHREFGRVLSEYSAVKPFAP